MNIKVTSVFVVFLLIQFNNTSCAQSTFQLGALPSLNFNKKFKNDWAINSKIESRLLFQRGEINGDIDKNFNYILTDLSFLGVKKVGLNARISGGYLIRFEEGAIYHRFIQQYVSVQKLTGYRLAHRFLSDQTVACSFFRQCNDRDYLSIIL